MGNCEIISVTTEEKGLLHAFVRVSAQAATADCFAALDAYAEQQGLVPAGRPCWRRDLEWEDVLEVSVCLLPTLELPPCQGQRMECTPPASDTAAEQRLAALRKRTAEERFLKRYCAQVPFEVPSQAVDAELAWQLGRLRVRLQRSQISMERHLKNLGKTEQQLCADLRGHAQTEVKERFVLLALAREQGLLVTVRQAEEAAARHGGAIDRMQLRQRLSAQRGAKYLVSQLTFSAEEGETVLS